MSSPSTIDFEEKLAKDDGHLDITIWFDYIKFLVQKQQQHQQQATDFISVNTVFERALRIPAHSQTSVKLWNMYLRERIKQQQQQSSSSPSSSVKSVHNLFLRAINTLQQQNGKKQETPLLSLFTTFFDFLVLCHREQAPLLIISTVKLSQQHLHPFALATFLQHVLATTSTKSNLLAIAVEVLTWILKTQQQHHRHNRQNKVNNLDKFLLPKIPLLTLYKFVRATLENFVDCGENNNQNDIGIEKNPFFVALVAALECLDLLTLLIAKGQTGDEDSSHNQREVLVSQLLLSSSQSNNQVIPYRRFVEDCLVPIMNHAMDNLNVNAPSPLIQKICYRFVTNIIWSLKQSGNNNNNNNNTIQTQAVADDEYNESSSLFCSSIVAAASCLSRNCCQDSSSSSSSSPSVDYASAARHLIKSSLPHCSNDDEVQTLYICLLALNRESSLVTQQKTSKKNDDNEEDAVAEGGEGDDENYGTDLSLDGLQREIVTRRTTRDPTNPANWLELIAIATEQQQQQDKNRGNRHEDDANDDNVITINDELFQRAISACTQEAALALEAQKRRNNNNNNNTNSRPVHLFLAYAAWLEQNFVTERHSRQQEQYSSDFGNNQDHVYLRSSSLSGSRNESRYAKSSVELLKRAVIASSSASSNNKDSTLNFPIIYAYSDRSLLLQAAAECILRTYQTYRIANTNDDAHEEGILECISFLAEVCGDSNNSNKSGEKAQSPLLPHGEYSAPLWAMRVELLLAIDRTDEAVQVCWRGMLSQANNNPASSNTNNISSKLLLIVADSLVARGIEIAENDIIMKQIIATSTAGIDNNNNNEDDSGTGGGNVQVINASFSNDTSLNPSQNTSYSHFLNNNNNNYSQQQQQQQQLTNEDSSNNLMAPSSSILLCSQNNNYDYSLRSFSQAQQEGFVAIAANDAIDDDTNGYYPPTTSTTKIKSSSNSLPTRSLHLFEQASRLVHTYLDILSKNPITSSKTSSTSSSLFTMYAVSFHLTLFLAPLLVHQDSRNNKNISRNLNQDSASSASSSSLIAPDYSYSLEMIRQLHKNTLNSLLLAQRDHPSNTTADVQKSLCWFALGLLEWDSGLNSNAIEAFMKFSEIEIKYANNKENTNADNSYNNEAAATERREVHDVNGDDSSSSSSPSYAAFAFTLRHAAKVLLSNIMVTSQKINDNSDSSSSISDGGNSNSSSSSSNAANVALFINLAETLMQQTPSVKELLKFGMQMLMYLFAIAPSANGNKNTSTSGTSGSIDSIIKNCLRSLAEYEDPIEDDCGVWKAWKDYVLRTNDLNGFNDMTRLRRDLVREKERRKEETIVV